MPRERPTGGEADREAEGIGDSHLEVPLQRARRTGTVMGEPWAAANISRQPSGIGYVRGIGELWSGAHTASRLGARSGPHPRIPKR